MARHSTAHKRNIIRVDRAAQLKLTSILLCTIWLKRCANLWLYWTLEHDFFLFPHFTIDLKHPNAIHALFSLRFFLRCIVDHYAFSLANNQDKSYLTLPFDRQHFGSLDSTANSDWNLSDRLRYHSYRYVIIFIWNLYRNWICRDADDKLIQRREEKKTKESACIGPTMNFNER